MFSKFNRHFIKAMQITIAGELTVAGVQTHRLQITSVIHTVEFVDKLYLRGSPAVSHDIAFHDLSETCTK